MKILGLGGSLRPASTSEFAVRRTLDIAAAAGAETALVSGESLRLPHYEPASELPPAAVQLLTEVRDADGIIIASPGYHGTVSGLIKNVLDYLEELREDQRPYLSARPVGCIVTAYGWQAAVTTLVTLRQTVHALRGWPSPFGATINIADPTVSLDGVIDERTDWMLSTVATDVMSFAALSAAAGAGR